MSLLFKAPRSFEPQEADRPLTRFKQIHQRKMPTAVSTSEMETRENWERSPRTYERVEAQHDRRSYAPEETPRAERADLGAELHASNPVSINVLRMALPMKYARAKAKAETNARLNAEYQSMAAVKA